MEYPHCGGDVSPSVPAPRWRVGEDGIIYFSVVSNGMTGEQWIAHLNGKGNHDVIPYVQRVLRSNDFIPTNGVVTEVVVLPSSLCGDINRAAENIRKEAERRKLGKLNAEVACLIHDMFTDEDIAKMSLRGLIVMHAPIRGFDGRPCLLGFSYDDEDDDGRCLDVYFDSLLLGWYRVDAFAFAAPAK